MPQPTEIGTQHCLARALYDNVPDSPDELQFRKGDTLVVLEQNTANIEGWWLCSLKGRQGICPANRLRLIPGVFEGTAQLRISPHFNESVDIAYLERQGKRRSWHVHPNQVVTPKKFNDVYLYDMPTSRCSPVPGAVVQPASACDGDVEYDVPPRAVPVASDAGVGVLPNTFRGCPRCSPQPPQQNNRDEAYDVPRPLSNPNQLTPSSSASSLTTADSLSSSNRSSLANMMSDYDVPRSYPNHHQHHSHQLQQQRSANGGRLPPQPSLHYDVPPSQIKQLPLELNSALESLERLQAETTSAVSRLLGFVGTNWRTRERFEGQVMEVRLAATRLRSSLHDLVDFGEGTLGNASKALDKNLAGKLAPLVAAIKRSDGLIQEACDKLNKHNWNPEILSRPSEEDRVSKPDELEQLIACARALTEDIRQIASFIQGNGLLLFKREPQPSIANNEWTEEYDYVSLESKENISKNHAEILKELPGELKKSYDECARRADDVAFDNSAAGLGGDDRQLLTFYAEQIVTHHTNLTHAIDAFLRTVERNQPPKVFLAHGKFVVLSAHKLVLIGDTVHRNVSCQEIKERALGCANALSDALASSVNKTKHAALQFPSVTAVQEMVDSVVDISHSAKDLKVCLVQAAVPTF